MFRKSDTRSIHRSILQLVFSLGYLVVDCRTVQVNLLEGGREQEDWVLPSVRLMEEDIGT